MFVSAVLLFCVGAMAIVGALQSGLTGNHETQYTKAKLYFISAAILASTLGLGVMLAAVSVFILQGSVLILALALNMIGITQIKLMNLLSVMLVPIVLCMFIK